LLPEFDTVISILFLLFPVAQSKRKILIQFFDARSASGSYQVILFFGILFEHQFNNLIEFSEIVFSDFFWKFLGNMKIIVGIM
jgi:hypothetical protein